MLAVSASYSASMQRADSPTVSRLFGSRKHPVQDTDKGVIDKPMLN